MTKKVKAGTCRPVKPGEDPRVEQMVCILRRMFGSLREARPKAS